MSRRSPWRPLAILASFILHVSYNEEPQAVRYETGHKEKTREVLLKETAKALRRVGPHQLGVAKVMASAGLTHGGFYAHFKSRDALIAEGIGRMFEESRARLPP